MKFIILLHLLTPISNLNVRILPFKSHLNDYDATHSVFQPLHFTSVFSQPFESRNTQCHNNELPMKMLVKSFGVYD